MYSGRKTIGLRVIGLAGALLALAALPAMATPPVPRWSLLPAPAQARPAAAGSVVVADGAAVRIVGPADAAVRAIATQFIARVAATRHLQLRMADAASARAAITFRLDPHAHADGDAAYRVTIGAGHIVASARTPRGLFYAGVTLWQLLTPAGWVAGAPAVVADGVIVDQPRFRWRGLLLDSGRHFQSVADVEKVIDWLSLHKMNVLLWHLTEDQGWRMQVPGYPELTTIGACRKAVGLDAELTGSPAKPYCGFYTDAEIRAVVRYAQAHYVTIVPGIDVPGHSQAAIAAYPRLGVTGQRPPVWTDWGVSPWLLDPDARTLGFLQHVLDHVMRLFPSQYISIGGDEATKQQWEASPAVRAEMHRLGLANMDQLQGWFTGQLATYLLQHGRTPVGWDDELLAGATLPQHEIIMTWHGRDGARVGLQALRQGHAIVMAPQESFYLDHVQSDLPDEWPGQPGMVTLQDVYAAAVTPQGATHDEASRVLGIQAELWTELMPTFARDQHALFPRLAAVAERAWSPAATHDWSGFLDRLPAQLARYRALGIGYADSAFAPAFTVSPAGAARLQVALANQADFGTIRYTTDGSAPDPQSPRYTRPLSFAADKAVTLRAAAFAADGFALSAPRAREIGPDSLLTRSGNALAPCRSGDEIRLAGATPPGQALPVYKMDVGDMCWLWHAAPVAGARHVTLQVQRIAWRFGDDAGRAVVRPASTRAGEFQVRLDSCTGRLLVSLPLATAAASPYPATLSGVIAKPVVKPGARALCVVATGDPRAGQWALGSIRLSR